MFSNKLRKLTEPSVEIVSKYLSTKTVVFLKSEDRVEVLKELVDVLDGQHKLDDKEAFLKAIMERERIVTTGIGMGVAIPHAKLSGYDSFFIAVGVHAKGLTWGSVDGVPVRLIFMVGGPDDKQTEYLQLLSRLTLAIKDDERRKKMLQFSNPKDIIALFRGL